MKRDVPHNNGQYWLSTHGLLQRHVPQSVAALCTPPLLVSSLFWGPAAQSDLPPPTTNMTSTGLRSRPYIYEYHSLLGNAEPATLPSSLLR